MEAAENNTAEARRPSPLKRLGVAFALAVVAGMLALLVYQLVTQQTARGFVNQIAAGDKPPAPGFSLARLDGKPGKVTLRQFRGHPVVVNFWASWCDPCKAEAPLLAKAWQRYRSRGVVFIGIDGGDFASDARSFLAKHGLGYLNLSDHAEASVGRWGVTGFPETFFIDAKGRAVAHIGLQIKTESELDAAIQKALE